MSSRHFVDAQLLPLLETLPELDCTVQALPSVRATMASMIEAAPIPEHLPVPQARRRSGRAAGLGQ